MNLDGLKKLDDNYIHPIIFRDRNPATSGKNFGIALLTDDDTNYAYTVVCTYSATQN